MKKIIYYAIGLILMFAPMNIWTNPTIQLLGVFIGSIFLWITCPIEIGSIFTLIALCMLPNVKSATIFSSAFGNNTILFLIFSMVLTYALSSTGVLKRVALYFINNNFARKNAKCFIGLYCLSMLVIGSFLAPTTLFVIYLGLANEIFSLLGLEKGDKLARNMMVGTGFFASISCAWTPIAHTFPLMALGYYETLTGNTISYIQYMKYAMPIGFILSIVAYLMLSHNLKGDYQFDNVQFVKTKWNRNEIMATIVFIGVVICWLMLGIMPTTFAKINAYGTSWVAMVGVAILGMLGILNVKDGFTKGVSWQSILLCASTLAIGTLLKSEDFGVMALLTETISPIVNKVDFVLILSAFVIILTNLISNIVTTTVAFNLFVPLIMGTAIYNPELATILIGVGASLAYALPSSIAHIALAGGSGWATNKDMLKYGSVMVVVSIILMWVVF